MRDITNVTTLRELARAPEGTPRLSMSLVGRLAIRFEGRPIELRTRKAAAVLGYLALSETKQESRERLVGLLWSRSDEEKARASLRQDQPIPLLPVAECRRRHTDHPLDRADAVDRNVRAFHGFVPYFIRNPPANAASTSNIESQTRQLFVISLTEVLTFIIISSSVGKGVRNLAGEMMDFAITTRAHADGSTLIAVSGELDLYRVPELAGALAAAAGRIVVDLEEVTFLDSTTLALLVQHHRRLEAAGHELIVLVGEQTPTSVFAVTGIDRILTIRPCDLSRVAEASSS